jgi:hypothetical protein
MQRVPIVEKELPTLPEHLGAQSVLNGIRPARSSIVFGVVFSRSSLVPLFRFFDHCIVCPEVRLLITFSIFTIFLT